MNVPNKIKIISPMTGVALYPKSTSLDNNASDIKIGTSVKANEALVMVHSKEGIGVTIKVSQLDISQIRYNEKALITSDAFPGITLKAEINRIDREATVPEYGGALPTFNVRVIVPKLTPTEYNAIRMGMSAEVAIQITVPKAIQVPISAVIMDNTQSFVNVIDPITLKIIKTPVQTGSTTQDSVEILSGLKNGDEVVSDATSH
jgi:multidrug efflux pump subunit AcrA (membrane-fusion protein)